jgi:hypothetical protein
MTSNCSWGGNQKMWNTIQITWDDCQIVEEIETIVNGGGGYVDAINTIHVDKKTRFIELTVILNGDRFKQTKEVKDISLSVDDIKSTINEIKRLVKVKV